LSAYFLDFLWTNREPNSEPLGTGLPVDTYFGGCRPELMAHLSAFSLTLSWLGRTGGFEPLGIFGSFVSFSMTALLGHKLPLKQTNINT
jgi:hypothetical protein